MITMLRNPKILIADEPPPPSMLLHGPARNDERHGHPFPRLAGYRTIWAWLQLCPENLYYVCRRIVEEGTTKDIFGNPRHPYTIGLLKCIPRLDEEEARKLVPIDGLPPNLIRMPPTCAFLPRCTSKIDICMREPWPGLTPIAGDREHYIRCYLNKEK
jgi:oligopeptide/dipeptide ABC transporter ATP-binding protein